MVVVQVRGATDAARESQSGAVVVVQVRGGGSCAKRTEYEILVTVKSFSTAKRRFKAPFLVLLLALTVLLPGVLPPL